MKNVDKLLSELGRSARKGTPPEVNVHSQVLTTISKQEVVFCTPKLDLVPIAFGGVAVAVAAIFCVVCFPSFQMLSDPWARYPAYSSSRTVSRNS